MSWLPYPENIPKKDGEYLVTRNSTVEISDFYSHTKFYDASGDKYYGPGWHDIMGGLHYDVVAFMDVPAPFRGES